MDHGTGFVLPAAGIDTRPKRKRGKALHSSFAIRSGVQQAADPANTNMADILYVEKSS